MFMTKFVSHLSNCEFSPFPVFQNDRIVNFLRYEADSHRRVTSVYGFAILINRFAEDSASGSFLSLSKYLILDYFGLVLITYVYSRTVRNDKIAILTCKHVVYRSLTCFCLFLENRRKIEKSKSEDFLAVPPIVF